VHEKRNLATPSPVTDGERVYAWFSTGQLAAVGMDGKPIWTRHLGKEYAVFDINWGHASSPAIHEDRLILVCYLGSSSYLLALDKRSGKELWKADRGTGLTSYTTPLAIELPRGPELVLNTSEGIEAIDPRTGERLWYFQETNRFPIPGPVFHDGLLYASRGYRSGPYMALRPGGSGDVSKTHLVWHIETGAPYVSSLVYHDGLVYMASELGIVTAVDAKTGERVWRERLGGLFTASPVVADGRVYLFSETGEAVVLKAGRTPEVLARNKLGEQIIASPAVSQGRLFVRSDRHLIAIGGASR
jgi:outer membrane protein assembly factor BamB